MMALPMLLAAAAIPPEIPPRTPVADRAGNWLLPGAGTSRLCTEDGIWCAEPVRDGEAWTLEIVERGGAPRRIALGPADEETEFHVWGDFIREAGGAILIGVFRRHSTSYSGGYANSSVLHVFRAEPGAAPPSEVLEVPDGGQASIRACFSRSDERARRGACADTYSFSAGLYFDTQNAAGPPRLRFQANANTYPGRRSRSEDSTQRPPLRAQDLEPWHDPTCSYDRVFSYDAAAGRYVPDAPLPDCSDYLDTGE